MTPQSVRLDRRRNSGLIYFSRWQEIWVKEGIMGVLGGREPAAKTDVLHRNIGNPRAIRELK
jgi:hypothetical protein